MPARPVPSVTDDVGSGWRSAAAPPRAEPAPPPSPPEPPKPAEPAPPPAEGPCPSGMRYVDTTFCSEVVRTCKKSEYSKSNHITLCHEFAPGTTCASPERRQRFCIDEYEYPNRKGAHPPVMVDWYDAEAACEANGKRLCWESEWVAACEGPDKLPFPAGLTRDPTKCNIDNTWTEPRLKAVYSSNAAVQNAELARIDQSVPSGAKEGCVSGFGVRDLTGNVDEWVISERNRGRSKWAGLKGGAWGHVRNACRPITFSHPPEFTYYFISFRCCADPRLPPDALAKPAADGVPVWRPPPVPAKRKAGPISPGVTPTK